MRTKMKTKNWEIIIKYTRYWNYDCKNDTPLPDNFKGTRKQAVNYIKNMISEEHNIDVEALEEVRGGDENNSRNY